MSGFTKTKCLNEKEQAISSLNLFIKNLIPLLPQEYNKNTILCMLELYYPHEVFLLNQKYGTIK